MWGFVNGSLSHACFAYRLLCLSRAPRPHGSVTLDVFTSSVRYVMYVIYEYAARRVRIAALLCFLAASWWN